MSKTTTISHQLDSVSSEYDYLFKILILGDSGVGKSSLLLRYTDDTFTDTFIATIGVDFKIRTVPLDNKNLKLQMWDTAGQDRFRSVVSAFYRNGDGVILVYDVTDMASFNKVEDWLRDVERYGRENICKLLIGNKADLKPKKVVDFEMGKTLADKLNMPFMETSAKLNTNVEQCFMSMAAELKVEADKKSVTSLKGELRVILSDGKDMHKNWYPCVC